MLNWHGHTKTIHCKLLGIALLLLLLALLLLLLALLLLLLALLAEGERSGPVRQ
jgi:hypothetical protein